MFVYDNKIQVCILYVYTIYSKIKLLQTSSSVMSEGISMLRLTDSIYPHPQEISQTPTTYQELEASTLNQNTQTVRCESKRAQIAVLFFTYAYNSALNNLHFEKNPL